MGEGSYSITSEQDAAIQAQTVEALQHAGNAVDGEEPGEEMTSQREIAAVAKLFSQGMISREEFDNLVSLKS